MTAPAPTASRPPAATSVNNRVLGGVLLVFGTGWLLKQTGVVDMPWAAVASLVLVALGLAMVATSRTRARTVPLMLLGLALTAGLAVGSSNIDIKGGVGNRTFTPLTLMASEKYHLGIGEMTIDLRRVNVGAHQTITADVGIGHLLVRVPPSVDYRIDVRTDFGNAVVFGQQLNIHGHARQSIQSPGYGTASRQLHLVLRAGVGEVEVK